MHPSVAPELFCKIGFATCGRYVHLIPSCRAPGRHRLAAHAPFILSPLETTPTPPATPPPQAHPSQSLLLSFYSTHSARLQIWKAAAALRSAQSQCERIGAPQQSILQANKWEGARGGGEHFRLELFDPMHGADCFVTRGGAKEWMGR